MKSLYKRQFALMAGMILISFALLGAAFITLSYQYTVREKRDSMERNALFVSAFTSDFLSRGYTVHDPGYQLYISSIATISDAYIILCENNGEIVYTSDDQLIGGYMPAAVIASLNEDGTYASMSTLDGLYAEKQFVAGAPIGRRIPFLNETRQSGMVFVTAESASITEMWRAFASIFFFTSVVVLCLAFITTSVTSLRQTKPLKEMADAVRKFGHGEFDVRVKDYGREDEVGELAEAFNAMADSLAQSEARRSEFVANISHELKTPMTTIAGFADGILDGTIPRERERESLQTISAETRRLSRLVRRMLDLSRLQSVENVTAQEPFDAVEVMIRVLLSLETKINARKLDVDTQLPQEPLLAWGDPDAITQVCYNLLDNAIKFASEGSTITLAIVSKGGKAHVTVRNVGETISAEELPMIFDRFHKTDRSRSADREGVGLGLYIVKTIINNHKESIAVTSEAGVTEFTFTLALA